MIQKGDDNLKYYKKLRRFCVKIQMIKIEYIDLIEIEEKAQPKYTYTNRMED
jgi:hypothetical protein